MSEFFDSIKQVKQNWQPYKKWDEEQDDKEAQRKELHKRHPISQKELEQAKSRGATIINAINVMDQYSENKSQDMEQATQTISIIPNLIGSFTGGYVGFKLSARIKNPMLKLFVNPLTTGLIGGLFASIPASIWSAKAQLMASKVARFQARENELKDPQNFVVYNQEQLEEGKNIAKSLTDEKKENGFFKDNGLVQMISTVKSVNKDKKAYEKWSETNQEEDKLIKYSYKDGIPENKLKNAKADQQILTNTVKKINQYAEDYSENVETATNTAGTAISLISAPVIGFAINYAIKFLNTAKILSEDSIIKKQQKTISSFAGLATTVFLQLWFTSLQKTAAKVGRFNAKQDLLSDPQNFVYYDDKQLETVKDIKAPKQKTGLFANFSESFTTLISLVKDTFKYNKYEKTQGKEDEKLRKALKQVKLNQGQLDEAKNLQGKTFNTFEKIDEMSEKYSENVEAATDVFTQSMPVLALLGLMGMVAGTASIIKNKFKDKNPEEIMKYLKKLENNKLLKNLIKDISTSFQITFKEFISTGKNPEKGDLLIGALKMPRVRNTVIAVGAPLVLGFLGSLYSLQSYLTNIQKRAGKVGTMKAIQELEDPRYFIDKIEVNNNKAEENNLNIKPKTSEYVKTPMLKSFLDKINQQSQQVA